MTDPGRVRRFGRDGDPGERLPQLGSTPERIVAAAVATLREEGFAGTSARSIARRGNFNQALIFYHFGSVLDVLVSALETVSADRLAQYRAAVTDVPDLRTALSVAREQYETDLREGHITVLVELIAGASSVPLLGREIVRCMEPWIAFSEQSIRRFLGGTALESLIPAREAAHALLSIYLGMEMLDHLDPDAGMARPLFAVAEQMLNAAGPLLGPAVRSKSDRSRLPQRLSLEGSEPPGPGGRRSRGTG